MRTLIPIQNGDLTATMQGFFKTLLASDVMDALLIPMATPAGPITPALVADPALLNAAMPLAPVMGLNTARVAGAVSIRQPRGRIGAVLRSCELRALVELVKLQQASFDDLITIGIDCIGTYDVSSYLARANEIAGWDLAKWSELYATPQALADQRDGCQMCEKPHPQGAHITLDLFGADLSTGIPVTLPDEIATSIGLASTSEEHNLKRSETLEAFVAARTETRDTRFAEIRQQLEKDGIESVMAACVRCHNCMTVCPICYCRTCLFKSPTFEHEPMQYINWARRKGAYRLPADTILFHLTRLNHMVLSCVGCGMCSSNCPAELPVGRVFRAIGQQVQATFDYEPGHSIDDPLPLITFREDEWTEIGEE